MSHPTALAVYTYAGGFSLGVQQAGFDVLAHFEDKYGVKTAALNFPKIDIRSPRSSWNPKDYAGKIDFVFANPPCAVFSRSSMRPGRGLNTHQEDPRTACYEHIYDVVKIVRPRVFAIESVSEALTRGAAVIRHLADRAERFGYNITLLTVNAARHGVPQNRKRFFFIGHTFQRVDFINPGLTDVTVRQALVEVLPQTFPTLTPYALDIRKMVRVMPKTGGKVRNYFERLRKHGDKRALQFKLPGFFPRSIDPDSVGPVVIGVSEWFHPNGNVFSLEEFKALCGFPHSFVFPESHGHTQRIQLLARGLAPPVAKYVSAQILKGLKKKDVKAALRAVDMTSGEPREYDWEPLEVDPLG